MLQSWTEILPLFIVRWLAKRLCEKLEYSYEGREIRTFVSARPDVLFKVEK